MTEPSIEHILRLRTGAGADACARALADAGGDPERALDLLYERSEARTMRGSQVGQTLGVQLAKTPAGPAREALLTKLLGREPHRALDVAMGLPRARRLDGPAPHRHAVVAGGLVVCIDTRSESAAPVAFATHATFADAETVARTWLGAPAPEPGRGGKKGARSAQAPAPTPETGSMSSAVRAQIERLGGVLPADTEVRATVRTALGESVLSPAVTAFAAVAWPEGRRFVYGDPEAVVRFGGAPVLERLAAEHDGPLYAIGYDELQYHVVVRADDLDADPRVYRIDHDGSTPLHSPQLLSALLKKVKSQSTAPAKGVGPELLEAIRDLDATRAVALVARAGDKVRAPLDKSGFTPLHYAAMAGLTEVVSALLAAGADPKAVLSGTMKFGKKFRGETWGASRELHTGETPLHEALFTDPQPVRRERDVLGVVRALLSAGADPNHADGYERTPLQLASRLGRGHDAVTVALLEAGADPNVESQAGGSPLGNALVVGIERTRILLAAGADPNRITKASVWEVKGATAMHLAASWNLADELAVLLDAGGDPNVRAGDGKRPIEHARPKTVELLRARGATE